jgi:hypothetical protein
MVVILSCPIPFECNNLVLFGRQRQKRLRRLRLLPRHQTVTTSDCSWSFGFGQTNTKQIWWRVLVSQDFGCIGVSMGTTWDNQITTLFQFRSWLNILAVVSRRQLKPCPLQQRPLCEINGYWPTLKDLCQKEWSQFILFLFFECHKLLVDLRAVQYVYLVQLFSSRSVPVLRGQNGNSRSWGEEIRQGWAWDSCPPVN